MKQVVILVLSLILFPWFILVNCDRLSSTKSLLVSDLMKSAEIVDVVNGKLRGDEIIQRSQNSNNEPNNNEKNGASKYKETNSYVNSIMFYLTIFAFLGNGFFMVYVFWLSK